MLLCIFWFIFNFLWMVKIEITIDPLLWILSIYLWIKINSRMNGIRENSIYFTASDKLTKENYLFLECHQKSPLYKGRQLAQSYVMDSFGHVEKC